MRIPILTLTIVALGISPIVHAADEEKADNTGRNASTATTAEEQSNSEAALKVTQAIRKAIMADDSLSMMAKNVKIITSDSSVTLRGPVETAAEKTKIAEIAKKEAGSLPVKDHIEVKK